MTARLIRSLALASAACLVFVVHLSGQNPQRGAAPAPTPKSVAPIDLTGYWVSLITEDWRYRMIPPAKGDYQGVPMTPAAVKLADAWDPRADQAAGLACKAYGAAAIMHVAGRIHVTWQDDFTLRLDTDAGTQTRLFRFRPAPAATKAARSWQGESAAQWDLGSRGRGANAVGGSLKVVTTNLRAGYLRKNGVPYSENVGLTEYFDVAPQRNGDQILVVTVVVNDPQNLDRQFVIASQFKKEADGAKWDPTPCSAT